MDEKAICDPHGLQKTGNAAGRLHREAEIPVLEDFERPVTQVGGYGRKPDLHRFDLHRAEPFDDEATDRVPAKKPESRNGPVAKDVRSKVLVIAFQPTGVDAGGIETANEAACTRADDQIGPQAVLLQYANDADVAVSTAPASAQHQRKSGRRGRRAVGLGPKRQPDRRPRGGGEKPPAFHAAHGRSPLFPSMSNATAVAACLPSTRRNVSPPSRAR